MYWAYHDHEIYWDLSDLLLQQCHYLGNLQNQKICMLVLKDFEVKTMLLLNGVHCFRKNALKSLAFSLKSCYKFIFMKKGRHVSIFFI